MMNATLDWYQRNSLGLARLVSFFKFFRGICVSYFIYFEVNVKGERLYSCVPRQICVTIVYERPQ